MDERIKNKQEIPPGWDYNPSSWHQRIPIVILAVVGMLIALYLGLYQMNIFGTVWDPFFGNGSIKILNSKISKVLPIPDAMLGAIGYFADALSGVIGGKKRWYTMPWMVLVFGFAVGPFGAISIMLVIFQPVLFNAWCTLCLSSAVISILMIGPAIDEVLASLQYMQRVKFSGGSMWKAFWGIKHALHQVE